MNGALVTAMLASSLAVIVVRRRTVAIAVLAAQSTALGLIALGLAGGKRTDLLVAAFLIATKALLLPALLYLLIRRTPEARPVKAAVSPAARLALAGAVSLCAVIFVPPLGIGDPHTEHISVAMVLIGITIVVSRRPILFQLIGLLVAENGLSLLAVSVPGGLSYVVELGAVFDLALVVTVAAAFAQAIHDDTGTGDTEMLRGLRD